VLKKYFADRGEGEQRTQIITTILSHPLNSAAPATKGFEVISLYPDENGYPSLENLKAVLNAVLGAAVYRAVRPLLDREGIGAGQEGRSHG